MAERGEAGSGMAKHGSEQQGKARQAREMTMNEQQTTDTTGIHFDPSWTDVADASTDEQARQRLAERFPTRKVTKAIEVDLTDAEIADKGRVLAGLEKEIEAAKALLKEECARLRSDVKLLEARRATVAGEIANGKGSVDVECEERLVFETNSLQTMRLDTGEVVSERALSAAERQGELFDASSVAGEVTDPADLLAKMDEGDEGDELGDEDADES